MVMKALRDGASGGVTKFILMGFMTLAVGGLVMMDVGGVFRGGVGGNEVAKIGDEAINIGYFDRTLRRSLSSVGMSPQEALKLGYLNQVLAGEIRSTLMKQAALDYDILISDDKAADHIQGLIQPLTQNGQSAKDVFQQILQSQSMREAEFVAAIKRDMANGVVMDMLNAHFGQLSDDMVIDLYKHKNEKRDLEYLAFNDSDVSDIPAPTEEQLLSLYNATRENYAIPEMRDIKVAMIDTQKLEATLSISDEDIKSVYNNNVDFYKVEATWTLDQAIVPTQEQATKIYDKVKNGTALE